MRFFGQFVEILGRKINQLTIYFFYITEELVIGVDLCLDNESGVCVWDSALCLGEMLMKRQQLSGSADCCLFTVSLCYVSLVFLIQYDHI